MNLDLTKADTGRIVDYWLGGHHNFEVDRAVADKVATITPTAPKWVQAQRTFLQKAVRQLPGVDGLTVTRLIKADPTTRSIPVIALTAHAMRGDAEMVFAAGCDDYIPKPIQIKPFRRILAKHVARLSVKSC